MPWILSQISLALSEQFSLYFFLSNITPVSLGQAQFLPITLFEPSPHICFPHSLHNLFLISLLFSFQHPTRSNPRGVSKATFYPVRKTAEERILCNRLSCRSSGLLRMITLYAPLLCSITTCVPFQVVLPWFLCRPLALYYPHKADNRLFIHSSFSRFWRPMNSLSTRGRSLQHGVSALPTPISLLVISLADTL